MDTTRKDAPPPSGRMFSEPFLIFCIDTAQLCGVAKVRYRLRCGLRYSTHLRPIQCTIDPVISSLCRAASDSAGFRSKRSRTTLSPELTNFSSDA